MNPETSVSPTGTTQWFSLPYALRFMFRKKGVFGWSLLLFFATVALTIVGYDLSTSYIDHLAGGFLTAPHSPGSSLSWLKYFSWEAGKWLFLLITRIAAFYLAFIIAYCLTTPGYAFLSTAVEKLHSGRLSGGDDSFSLGGVMVDLIEGIKIGLFGVFVTIVALLVNFIPGIGQVVVFLLYTYYSALLFIDYPASRRRWSLGRKIGWLKRHRGTAFRLGLLPALISMVPLINVFFMSLLFPVLTIQSTLNFASIEQQADFR